MYAYIYMYVLTCHIFAGDAYTPWHRSHTNQEITYIYIYTYIHMYVLTCHILAGDAYTPLHRSHTDQ